MDVTQKSVALGEIIKEFDLEVLNPGPDYEKTPLRSVDVNRPGLPLSGFFEHFDTMRLLLIGLSNFQSVQAEFHSCTKFAKLFIVEVWQHLLLYLCD